QVIDTVGRRLFRRPLSEQEITAYLTLQSFATENNPSVAHDFYTAVNLMLRSMLQDPEFLYRIEIGTPTADPAALRLNSYETTALVDKIVFDQPASYLTLFSANQTYVNDLLADQYGLPRPAGGAGWVDYGASGRAGILSHGAVLAAFSKFSDTSPTQRGILV